MTIVEFSGLVDLYTTLFVLAITALGVLMAAIIALTQLLESFLVSKSARRVVYSRVLVASFVLIGIAGIVALAPMVLLSIQSHNFIPQIDLGMDAIFTGHWYIFMSVIFFIMATIGVVVFIYRASQYLIPVNAIAFLRDSQKYENIANYFQKGSATKPLPPMRFSFILGDDEEDPDNDKSDEAKEKQYRKDLKKYESDQVRLAAMENPLFPLEAYLIRSIRDGNVTIARKTLEAFEEIIKNSIADKNFKGDYALISYYKTVLENADELAQSVGLQSVSLELLDSSSRVADMFIQYQLYPQINVLLEYWQALASEAMRKAPTVFKRSVDIMSDVGRSMLRVKNTTWEQIGDLVDNISRSLGWLGERLLDQPPERRALMLNTDYSTEFDAVMNAVSEIGWGIRSDRPEMYPLIHFDSLFVIANKLASYVTDDEYNNDNGNSLFSLMYDVYSCGEAAILAKNMEGACLALLRLEEHCKIAEEHGLEKHKQQVLNEILRLGALAAGKDLQGIAHFMISRNASSLSEAATDVLSKHVRGYDLNHEAHEIMIKLVTGGNDYEKVKQYLAKTGHVLGTDFGMNLSSEEPSNPDQ